MSQVIEVNRAAENFAPPLETPPVALDESDVGASLEATGGEAPRAQKGEGLNSLEELREQVAEGFMYSHSRENANTTKVLEVASFSYALIELLAERGVITVAELDERKKQVGQRLVEKFVETGLGVALTDDEGDKYSYQSEVQIDCESRLALCRGACCRLKFALTVQDLEEGKVKWDLGRPYMIRHGADGYCYHIEKEAHRCTIYENRPVVCRSYDCRKDKRIWSDFEARLINPEIEKLFPKAARSADGAAADDTARGGEPRLYQLSRTQASA